MLSVSSSMCSKHPRGCLWKQKMRKRLIGKCNVIIFVVLIQMGKSCAQCEKKLNEMNEKFFSLGIHLVWTQSIGFPTYCLVVTAMEKVTNKITVALVWSRKTAESTFTWFTLIAVESGCWFFYVQHIIHEEWVRISKHSEEKTRKKGDYVSIFGTQRASECFVSFSFTH